MSTPDHPTEKFPAATVENYGMQQLRDKLDGLTRHIQAEEADAQADADGPIVAAVRKLNRERNEAMALLGEIMLTAAECFEQEWGQWSRRYEALTKTEGH